MPESLKNILLVMANGGYLVAPPNNDPGKERIWTETQKRLDRFLPNLFREIFPTTPADAPSSRHGGSRTMRPEAKQQSNPDPVDSKDQRVDMPNDTGSTADTEKAEVGQAEPTAAEPADEVE